MLAEPTAKQLIEATASYLEAQLPSLTGRAAFHGRVAVNVLKIVARELDLGPAAAVRETEGLRKLIASDADLPALRADLCTRIRDGKITAQTIGLLDHLLTTVRDRVEIEQPQYGSMKLARAA